MKKLIFLFVWAWLVPSAGLAATFQAILVVASREAKESDPRLAPYEANLKRLLRFEGFKQVGQGRAQIDIPGTGTIDLGAGQSLELATTADAKAGTKVQITWQEGSQLFMNTGLVLRAGVPAVLGGPATGEGDGEVYAVILIVK